MRRFVRDRIAVALEREKPALQEFVSEQLSYPEGFPYDFSHPVVMIRDIRKLKIIPLARGLTIWPGTMIVRLLTGGL